MLRELKDLVRIRTGFTFRESPEVREAGVYRMVNIKEVRQGQVLDLSLLTPFDWDAKIAPPVLEPGDVLLAARGEHNTASVYKGGGNVVPSSQLLVLSPKTDRLLSDFLCWSLNQPAAARYFEGERRGSSIPSIGKAALEVMKIKVPSVKAQRQILELKSLMDQEKELTEKLHKNREMQVSYLYQKLLEQ